MKFESEDVVVKESPIEGLGVFANRDFKKGEIVLTWHPKKITPEEEATLSKDERDRYVNTLEDGTRVLMGIPERYVNHVDDANTRPEGMKDVATRDIQKGDEVTGNYIK